jgi:hypothetical protein
MITSGFLIFPLLHSAPPFSMFDLVIGDLADYKICRPERTEAKTSNLKFGVGGTA